jgi:hypothetical protein
MDYCDLGQELVDFLWPYKAGENQLVQSGGSDQTLVRFSYFLQTLMSSLQCFSYQQSRHVYGSKIISPMLDRTEPTLQ